MAQTIQEQRPTTTSTGDMDARFRRAQERIQAIRGFYIHLSIYLIINLGLFILNWVLVQTNGSGWFFYWPLLGWGIAVVINAFVVFGADRFLGADWEERKIREEMAKQR